MPSDFQFKEPPLALRIPKGRPWYGMDIFWNCPFVWCVMTSKESFNNDAGTERVKPHHDSFFSTSQPLSQ